MIKCVVPISGGKDSQACLKLALKQFDPSEIVGLFCDTKFEHPLTYAHIDRMREMYGVEIRVLTTRAYGSKVANADLMVQTKRKTKLEHDDLFDAPPCMMCQI